MAQFCLRNGETSIKGVVSVNMLLIKSHVLIEYGHVSSGLVVYSGSFLCALRPLQS